MTPKFILCKPPAIVIAQKWVALSTIHEHISNQTLGGGPLVPDSFSLPLDDQYLPPSVFVALNGTL